MKRSSYDKKFQNSFAFLVRFLFNDDNSLICKTGTCDHAGVKIRLKKAPTLFTLLFLQITSEVSKSAFTYSNLSLNFEN